MTDPVRWSQTPGLPAELARAIDAGRAIEPPAGMQQQVLQGVLGAVGVVGAGVAAASLSAGVAKAATNAGTIAVVGSGGTASVTGATGVMGLTSIKLAALALGSVGVISASVALQPARQPAHHVSRPAVTASAHAHGHAHGPAHAPEPASASAAVTPPPEAELPLLPEPSVVQAEPAQSPLPTRTSRSEKRAPVPKPTPAVAQPQSAPTPSWISESQLVLEARARLREGDSAGALASLDAADGAGGPSVLSQERALLRIHILQRLGWIDDARANAAHFVATYPNSPYAAELRGLLTRTTSWPARDAERPADSPAPSQ